jgi:quercetin dioxygenase-like cupin family protein
MIIKKRKEFEPIVKDDSEIKSVNYYPMLTAKDGTPTFAMRLFEIGPGGYTPKHRHDWEHEVYIVSGDGFVFKDGMDVRVEKDDFIYVEPSELHQFRAGNIGMTMICVVPNRGQS